MRSSNALPSLLLPAACLTAGLVLATTARSDAFDLADQGLPPAWQSGGESQGSTSESGDILGEGRRTPPPSRRQPRPWYLPRFAVGIGTNIPELIPIEGYAFFGRYFALRAFYTPPLPIPIRVNMPSDVIAVTDKTLAVANPAFTINGKATYGEHYGLEALVFPFGGSFFLGLGASHRHMRVVADAKSPILVCSVIEAAKDPPCGDPTAAIETRTDLTAHADATTDALLLRGSVGWFWHVGAAGYFMFNMGIAHPTRIERSASVDVGLATPEDPNPQITGALAELRNERQADLNNQAAAALSPVDTKVLPILGVGAGVRF